jgi:hypothetical protein
LTKAFDVMVYHYHGGIYLRHIHYAKKNEYD